MALLFAFSTAIDAANGLLFGGISPRSEVGADLPGGVVAGVCGRVDFGGDSPG